MRRLVAALGCVSLLVTAACSGGGSKRSFAPALAAPSPGATLASNPNQPVPTSTTSGGGTFTASAYACPTADSTTSVGVGSGSQLEAVRRMPAGGARNVASLETSTITRLAVSYALAAAPTTRAALATRISGANVSATQTLRFANTGVEMQIVAVPTSQATTIAASLRAQSGVTSVAVAGGRRMPLAVNDPYYPNDPYFQGFTTTVATSSGATPPPSTYHAQPLVESADVPGQWEMHVIGIDRAFGYSQSGNGSGIVSPAALGSSSVKIAVIDTGMDTAHPDLAGKIARQRCFITNPANVQSTSNFVTDVDGHGTDVTGIAAAAANNGLGFAGAGGNSQVLAYRVQPTPDDNCVPGSTAALNDPQCSVYTIDLASAINDAVSQGANVIAISLGGGTCTSGNDPDPTEGQAIANAIAANVVIVAASGNDGVSPIGAPACDSGVIAAGASALADGQPNGASNSSGSASTPTEYVASYSDYGSPGSNVNSSSAWGIVAPGGDPTGGSDLDNLHWIENIWTSTPFDAKFSGTCVSDYPNSNSSGTTDCRSLIAGTSMSTPIVAGTAALILAVNPGYQSSAKMKALLCSTATNINDSKQGCGRLNAYKAMAVALGDSNPPQ